MKILKLTSISIGILLTSACGGGSGSSETTTPPPINTNKNPTISVSAPNNIEYNEPVEITWTTSDPDGDNVQVTAEFPNIIANYELTDSKLSFIAPSTVSEMNLTLTFTASDGNGGSVRQSEVITLAQTTMIESSNIDENGELDKDEPLTVFVNGPMALTNITEDNFLIKDKDGNDITFEFSHDNELNAFKFYSRELGYGNSLIFSSNNLQTADGKPSPNYTIEFTSEEITAKLINTGDIVPYNSSIDGSIYLGITQPLTTDDTLTKHMSRDNLESWSDANKIPYKNMDYTRNYNNYFSPPESLSSLMFIDLKRPDHDCANSLAEVNVHTISEEHRIRKLLTQEDIGENCSSLYLNIIAKTTQGVIVSSLAQQDSNSQNANIVRYKHVTMSEILTIPESEVLNKYPSEFFHLSSMIIPTTDEDIYYVGEHVTLDGGKTWQEFGSRRIINFTKYPTSANFIFSNPENPAEVVSENIYYSKDNGQTWKDMFELGGNEVAGMYKHLLIGFYNFGRGYRLTSISTILANKVSYHQYNNDTMNWELIVEIDVNASYPGYFNYMISNQGLVALDQVQNSNNYSSMTYKFN